MRRSVCVCACALPFAIAAASAVAQCNQWTNESPGLNGAVYATTVWDPDGPGGPIAPRLVAGGDFTTANGVAALRIAQWTGAAWAPMGNGLNGPVRALAVYRGELIAGGEFTSSGPTTLNGIGAWDGTQWRAFTQAPVPIGVNGNVRALLPRADVLIVGGAFSSCGGVAASCIAQWDGGTVPGSWSPIGNGFNFMVQCIADHEGTLFAGGAFNFSGGQPLGRIGMFSGGGWQPMGAGCDSNPNAMLSHNGTLYVAGTFTLAGGLTVNKVARWTAAGGWAPMSTGLGGQVGGAWLEHNGGVLIGGQFTTAGGVPAVCVARWTGSAFEPFGTGLGTRVYSLTRYGSEIVAGGTLVIPAGSPVGVARWRLPACPPDVNCDGAATPADVAAFVNTWSASLSAGTLAGDFDGNGAVQPADVAVFVSAWFAAVSAGCPPLP